MSRIERKSWFLQIHKLVEILSLYFLSCLLLLTMKHTNVINATLLSAVLTRKVVEVNWRKREQ